VLLTRPPVLSETVLKESAAGSPKSGIIVFEGMDGLFSPILAGHKLLRRELVSITRPEHLRGLTNPDQESITVHVRRGDFKPVSEVNLRNGAWSTRLPLDWYKSAIEACRRALPKGQDAPVRIFSDGTDDELRALLSIPGTRRCTFGPSLADLHALSASRVLIASGGSTFSMWASYLGRMPVIWYPGQLRCRLYYDTPEGEIELEAGSNVPDGFAALLRSCTREEALV
jgi:hypothetical protein